MSEYRELSENHDITFDELEILDKLLMRKKLTEKQRKAFYMRHYFFCKLLTHGKSL